MAAALYPVKLQILIRARQPADGEFDLVAGQDPPALDLGLVGRLGKAAEHFARLFPGRLARQRKGLAPKRTGAGPSGHQSGRLSGDVERTPGHTPNDSRHFTRNRPRRLIYDLQCRNASRRFAGHDGANFPREAQMFRGPNVPREALVTNIRAGYRLAPICRRVCQLGCLCHLGLLAAFAWGFAGPAAAQKSEVDLQLALMVDGTCVSAIGRERP